MTVEGRVSSFSESMSVLGPLVRRLDLLPPNLVMCTDDIFPEDLLRRGHMDNVVRQAISHGLTPAEAVRAASLNGALRHRLYDLGAIAPGKRADIVLLPDLERFEPDEVLVNGQVVARAGQMVVDLPWDSADLETENTVHLPRLPDTADFVLPSRPGRTMETVRVLVITPTRHRELQILRVPVLNGQVDIVHLADVCLVAVLERHGRTTNRSLVPVKGLGLQRGAVASTVAHDSHNLLILGRDAKDMALAARQLAACGGGICCVHGGEVLALLPLPIAGLMSPLSLRDLVPLVETVSGTMRNLGMDFERPLGAILGLTLPVIPDYSVTDLGLVDVARQTILPIWADEE